MLTVVSGYDWKTLLRTSFSDVSTIWRSSALNRSTRPTCSRASKYASWGALAYNQSNQAVHIRRSTIAGTSEQFSVVFRISSMATRTELLISSQK